MIKIILLIAVVAMGCTSAFRKAQSTHSRNFEYYAPEHALRHFEQFMHTHGRKYADSQEKSERFEIFRRKLQDINKLNRKSNHAVYGINKFADWTKEEMNHLFKYRPLNEEEKKNYPSRVFPHEHFLNRSAPDHYDWRDQGAVASVKNQGQKCGSCWAFSTTGALEGQYAIKHGQVVEFSEQQLVDCDKTDGGCKGGNVMKAFAYLKASGGLESESDYPYVATDGTCQFDTKKVAVTVAGANLYQGLDEDKLMQVLHDVGPLSISIDADDIQYYQGGIVKQCQSTRIDHAVLLVGYGDDNGVPFWTIKNSWGEDYGERGYVRIKRGENLCGILTEIAAPEL